MFLLHILQSPHSTTKIINYELTINRLKPSWDNMQFGYRSFFLLLVSEMFSRASCLRRFDTRVMMLSSGASLSPPPEPINFASKFFIPQSNEPLELEQRNLHPLDSRIKFESAGHKYYFDGKLMERSVTEIVGNYFETFDADLVIRKMMTGNNWPRPEYMRRDGEPMNVSVTL